MRVFVARQGHHELTSAIPTAEQVRELVERMLSSSGRRLDISRGFAAVNIRTFVAAAHSLDDLVTLGTLDSQAATYLDASVRAGLNVIVSGGTQTDRFPQY